MYGDRRGGLCAARPLGFIAVYMSQSMSKRYLAHRRTAKAQESLRIRAV